MKVLQGLAACRPRAVSSCRRLGPRQTRCFKTKDSSMSLRSDALSVDKLMRLPARYIYDVTSPTNSHLLNVTLDEHLPTTCLPKVHQLNQGKHPCAPMSRLQLDMAQGHHFVYFPTPINPSQLEPDGTDPFHSPGGPFTRRVWASGSIDFTRDSLKLDSTPAVCIETVEKVESKGIPGNNKIFVHLMRRYMAMDQRRVDRFNSKETNCLTERRVLAFMRTLKPGQDPNAPASIADERILKAPWHPEAIVETVITPQMLFYFSALTMNAHAIHLNAQHSTKVEGHKGLLIHGPLSVVLMLRVIASLFNTGHYGEAIKFFEYRNLAPLYANKAIRICASAPQPDRRPEYKSSHRRTIWIEDENGSLCVKGTAFMGPKKGLNFDKLPEYKPPPAPRPLPEVVALEVQKTRMAQEEIARISAKSLLEPSLPKLPRLAPRFRTKAGGVERSMQRHMLEYYAATMGKRLPLTMGRLKKNLSFVHPGGGRPRYPDSSPYPTGRRRFPTARRYPKNDP